MLRRTDQPIASVVQKVGFDRSDLTRAFHREMDITPSGSSERRRAPDKWKRSGAITRQPRSHQEMAPLLCIADIGLLFRKDLRSIAQDYAITRDGLSHIVQSDFGAQADLSEYRSEQTHQMVNTTVGDGCDDP